MNDSNKPNWAEKLAELLPGLADAETVEKSAGAAFQLRTENFKSLPKAERENYDLRSWKQERQMTKAAASLIVDQLHTLIPKWIDVLLQMMAEARQNNQENIAARTAGKETDKKLISHTIEIIELQRTLAGIGEQLDAFLQPLIDALGAIGQHEDDSILRLLQFAGPGIVAAKPALFERLRADGVWSRPSGICLALARTAVFDASLVPSLQAMMNEDDTKLRQSAAAVLGAIGDTGAAAVDDLLRLETGTTEERISVIYALATQKNQSEAVFDVLKRALCDSNGYVRRAAAYSVGKLRADASRFVPMLIAACDDAEALHDTSVPETAVNALSEYGPLAISAIPRLRQFLEGPIVGRSVKPKWVRKAISSISPVEVQLEVITPLHRETVAGENEPLFPVIHRERLCYIDCNGRIVIQTEFSHGGSFNSGRAIVGTGRNSVVIDRAGRIVFERKWRSMQPFSEGFAGVKEGNKWGFVDVEGKIVVEPIYDSVTRFSEGLAGAEIGRTAVPLGKSATMNRPGKKGFIDTTGKVVIPIEYEDVQPFHDGRATVCLGSTMKPNPIFADRPWPSDRKYGLLDRSGKIVVDGLYSAIGQFRDGLAAVFVGELLRGRHGYIKRDGRVAIPLKFSSANDFNDGVARIGMRGKRNRRRSIFINTVGDIVLKTDLHVGFSGFSEGLAGVEIDDLWGVVDLNGKVVIQPQFDDIGPFNHGIAWFERGAWHGFIDKSGIIIWGPTTESVYGGRLIEDEWT